MPHLRQTTEVRLESIVGESQPFQYVKTQIKRVAPTSVTVLLEGETGVGKNLLARATHGLSNVAAGNFVQIACGAIPRELIESEIFGHEAGSFTGSRQGGKPGLLEVADGGTVFLDEIEDLPLDLQSRLLEFLEEGTIRRLGSLASKTLHVRVIVATNANLREMMAEKRFRKDLYYRLEEYPILIPPLREREPDIPLLTDHFMYGTGKTVEKSAVERLSVYDWPGNVRQLRNVLSRARINARGERIGIGELPPVVSKATYQPHPEIQLSFLRPNGVPMSLKECERAYLVFLLKVAGGNQTRAADISGISRKGLYNKLQRYGLSDLIEEHGTGAPEDETK